MPDPYSARPWLKLYDGLPQSVVDRRPPSPLTRFREHSAATPDMPAVRYFDATISYGELDRLSDAFAVWLEQSGVAPGSHILIVLNNVPHFLVALVGTWKAGAVPVPSNPMYRLAERVKIFADAKPAVIVCHHDQVDVVRDALSETGLASKLLAVDPYDFQTQDDTRVLPPRGAHHKEVGDFLETLEAIIARGDKPFSSSPSPDALGLILYTSGTTGTPKGAMLTHQALAQSGCAARPWTKMATHSQQFVIAPLFHITGLVTGCCASFDGGCGMTLTYRFHPQLALETITRFHPNFIVAPTTVYVALLGLEGVDRESMSSFTSVYTGGAPTPPAIVRDFEARTGLIMYPAFGMTETGGGAIAAPHGSLVPVDQSAGALAVGIPMTDVDVMVIDDEGAPAAVGTPGELLTRGPALMNGYLNKPEDTAETLRGGWMHTGDIAFMDEAGWFYIVYRKKDMINAAGYKVWPREVEDALYEHPHIREAAVIGIPDAYRGESVKAVISLKPGAALAESDIIAHCRDRLAAYKVPRVIDILDDLPKTATGKVSRALLKQDTSR